MKKIFTLVLTLTIATATSFACTVCKTQQTGLFRGITHGSGPESDWDYLIVGVMVAVVIGTFLMSARYLAKPGEKNQEHIKYSIIGEKDYGN